MSKKELKYIEQSAEQYTDEKLLELYNNGETSYFDILMYRYKNMVREIANDYFITSGDADDLIQEGMIGLYKAVRDYKSGNGAQFSTFAYMCIKRQIITAVTQDNNKKNMPLNTSMSFETDNSDNDTTDEMLLSDKGVSNPEFLVIDKEDNIEKKEKLMLSLSSLEKEVCEMMFRECNYRQIAIELGKEEKVIDNAMQRIKLKARKLFS